MATLKEIMKLAKTAVYLDQIGHYEPAIYFYRKAADAVMSQVYAGILNTNATSSAEQYLVRAEALKTHVASMEKSENYDNFDAVKSVKEQPPSIDQAYFLLHCAFKEDEVGQWDDAIVLYTEAVDIILHAAKHATDQETITKLGHIAKDTLERAELLKRKSQLSGQLARTVSTICAVNNLALQLRKVSSDGTMYDDDAEHMYEDIDNYNLPAPAFSPYNNINNNNNNNNNVGQPSERNFAGARHASLDDSPRFRAPVVDVSRPVSEMLLPKKKPKERNRISNMFYRFSHFGTHHEPEKSSMSELSNMLKKIGIDAMALAGSDQRFISKFIDKNGGVEQLRQELAAERPTTSSVTSEECSEAYETPNSSKSIPPVPRIPLPELPHEQQSLVTNSMRTSQENHHTQEGGSPIRPQVERLVESSSGRNNGLIDKLAKAYAERKANPPVIDEGISSGSDADNDDFDNPVEETDDHSIVRM